MTIYTLYKGFKKLREFTSIRKAKNYTNTDGVYKLVGSDGYSDSWQILNGVIY